jgi:hypothetical protein
MANKSNKYKVLSAILVLAFASFLSSCSSETLPEPKSAADFLPTFCKSLDNRIAAVTSPVGVINVAEKSGSDLDDFLYELLADDSAVNDNTKEFQAGMDLNTALESIAEAFFEDSSISKLGQHETVTQTCALVGVTMESWQSQSALLLPSGIWSDTAWKKYIRANMQTVGDTLLDDACSPMGGAFDYTADFSIKGTMYAIYDGRPYWSFFEPDDYVTSYGIYIQLNSDALEMLNCPTEVYDNYLQSKLYNLEEVIRVLRSNGKV